MSWVGVRNTLAPGTWANCGRSRSMTWRAVAARSSRGLSTMVKLPVLAGLGLSVLPVCDPIDCTSGSRRMMAPSSCCRRIISCGETSWEACGDAGNQAGVLDREKALGRVDREIRP